MARLKTCCPKCQARYSVDEANAGKKAKCPKCGAVFAISTLSGTASPAAPIQAVATQPAVIRAVPAPQVTQPDRGPANADAQRTEAAVPLGAEDAARVSAQTVGATPSQDAAASGEAEANVPAEWNVGDVILDTYEVKQVHTGGGMGLVYRVHHRNWNMDLAVKSPRSEYFLTEDQKANFVRECEAWINLGLHPNIVSCYYVRTLGDIPRVFAEYVGGGSLKDWIESKGLYEGGPDEALKRILDMAIQMAWGLHYAHEHKQHLIHQDVKPANVMMTPDGEAKVTDFGLAKARAAAGEAMGGGPQRSILVSSGGMTPAYCSPEQANHEPLSKKTDTWSWGLSVLEMFAGEVTWANGVAAAEALQAYLDTGAEDESIPKMPQGVVDLLRQCFQRQPDDRPKDMAEVAARMKETYKQTTGEDYPREEPKAVELLADSLNNRAASMTDLGRKDEAEKLFDEALHDDPHHPEAMYNRGLLLWRSGRMTDVQLIIRLEDVGRTQPDSWRPEYLSGLVHIERGDAESAEKAFEEALAKSGKSADVQRALLAARSVAQDGGRCLRTFEGHAGSITSVAVSPDGRFGLSGSEDKALRLWDLATGRCLMVFEGHADSVKSVAVSPDGRFGLSGSADETLRLWDLATGRCLRTFRDDCIVGSVAISPDGRLGFSGSGWELRLWNLSASKGLLRTLSKGLLRTFEGYKRGMVGSVAFGPHGRFGLSGNGLALCLWELATGRCLRVFEGHSRDVCSVAVSPDGRFGLSGSEDETLRLWDLATGRCLRVFEGHSGNVNSVAISPDGRFGLSASSDQTLRQWKLSTGQCLRTFKGGGLMMSVAISRDGRFILSGSYDNTLSLWALPRGGRPSPHIIVRPLAAEVAKAESDGFQVLMRQARDALARGAAKEAASAVTRAREIPRRAREREALGLWARIGQSGRRTALLSAGRLATLEGHSRDVCSVAISPDCRFGLSGSADKTLRLWNLATGQCLRVFEGHSGTVESVAISPDGQFGLSGSFDKTLRLWDLATGQCLRVSQGHTKGPSSGAVSRDGRLGLSGGDSYLRLWDLTTCECFRVLDGHTAYVDGVAISPDGRFGLSCSGDHTLRLWDLATGRCLRAFEVHPDRLTSVAISPDGRLGISGSLNHTLRLWDLSTGQCLRSLDLGQSIWSMAIGPDGRFVVLGSHRETVGVYDLTTGQCLRVFKEHTGGVSSVAVSQDGRFILSGGFDTRPCLYEMVWDFEFPDAADWDDGALPYLETFLTLHCPHGEDRVSCAGKPNWTDGDFQGLVAELQHRGYGWLQPEGVRRKLEEMTANWQGPPPLPWETK